MKNKRIIVILGTGRSGTSLLMQFLSKIGISHAKEVLIPDNSNPKGFIEDLNIVKAQEEFFADLYKMQGTPYPIIIEKDLKSSRGKRLKDKLQKHILEELKYNDLYAIKNPRISTVLSIWQEIFVENNIEPIYIFPIRNPISVIKSINKYYGIDPIMVEYMWLQRTILSFYYAKSNLFILHYERWFTQPKKQLRSILKHLNFTPKESIGDIVDNVLDNSLYRIKVESENIIKNSEIDDIYRKIVGIEGCEFKREEINDFFESKYKSFMSYSRSFRCMLELNTKKVFDRDNILEQKQKQIEELRKECRKMSDIFESKQDTINKMKSSKFWKIREVYMKYKSKI